MSGEILTIEELEALSRLPGRDVLHGQLVGVLASPLTGLARGLNGLVSGLAVALGQIAEQGLVGGDAPEPEATSEPEATPEPDAAPEAADDEPTDAPEEGATTDSEEA
jgi:large subunit ribosomal protein L10